MRPESPSRSSWPTTTRWDGGCDPRARICWRPPSRARSADARANRIPDVRGAHWRAVYDRLRTRVLPQCPTGPAGDRLLQRTRPRDPLRLHRHASGSLPLPASGRAHGLPRDHVRLGALDRQLYWILTSVAVLGAAVAVSN